MTHAISCQTLDVDLAGRRILCGLSFHIPQGSIVAVLGPNGAGKSTFFRTLLGLTPVTRGALSLFGQPVRRGRADIGYLPQTRSMIGPRLTGRAHIMATLEGNRWGLASKKRGTEELEAVLLELNATDLADRPFGTLSGGERQRLMLAQAMLGHPRLLLLDEPLASLDPGRMREVAELTGNLVRARGITALISAHDINPLIGIVDRVLYLAGGHARIGTPDEILTAPVLSRLYGTPVDVFHAPSGQIFVAPGREA